ncbi:MAG TPA: heme lyase CcmF/NrfE family subunit [Gammaproteobacteria bacterium]|jgi:cytochrome c-type biogenesis protein CcmF|nr:heme lyase CcmF/NrfE family subunit [Gammaproteobacteria bacterium]
MVRLLGELSLFCALGFSFLQALIPLMGYLFSRVHALASARVFALAQCAFVLAAYVLLTIAFCTDDFSIAYVAANSHPLLPFLYKLTAIWGAHEGSILLWILVLSGWTFVFSFTDRTICYALTLSFLGMISFGFLVFLVCTSDPFAPLLVNTMPRDLNPLLQDIGFIMHPPMLYIGYVGFALVFALTQARLVAGKLDAAWAAMTRHFALAAWCFLTLGISLGSWWAYRVLGWGGFWFWDPVENASLLPWLSGIALIHVLLVCEKRHVAIAWAVLLSLICFILSLLGTFLVRSGVLISVHTFANDPKRGMFLLLLLAIVCIMTFIVYAVHFSKLSTRPKISFLPCSREMALLCNSALLIIAMLTILLGTLYPLIIEVLQYGVISVGPPYFNTVMTPLLFLLMLLMSIGPLSEWQKQHGRQLATLFLKNMLYGMVIAIALLWGVSGEIQWMPVCSLALSISIVLSVLPSARRSPGMAIAHTGFAILIIGILLSSLLSEERDVRIKPGDTMALGPYTFFFSSTENADGANYEGIRGVFDVIKNKHPVTTLYPEKRIYTVRQMVMTKVDIHPGLFRDLYLALGEPLNQGFWSVRVYYKPFIRWIWFGGGLMMLGGFIALFKRRES